MRGNYLDVPDTFSLRLPITYQDRLDGVCWDQHHCTIANAIHNQGASVGITFLERSGVSRTLVRLRLDPKVFPWAKADQEYRAYLPPSSQAVAAELDDWYNDPVGHRRFKAALKAKAMGYRKKTKEVWLSISIDAPPPSRKKGYAAGKTGTNVRAVPSMVTGVPNRRYNGYWSVPVAKPGRLKKATP